MKAFLIPAVVLTLNIPAAFAQGGGQGGAEGPKGHRPSPEKVLEHLDSNKDGKVSLDEWKAGPRGKKNPEKAEAKFKKLDTNQDGTLSLDELKAHQPPKGAGPGGKGGGKKHKANE